MRVAENVNHYSLINQMFIYIFYLISNWPKLQSYGYLDDDTPCLIVNIMIYGESRQLQLQQIVR